MDTSRVQVERSTTRRCSPSLNHQPTAASGASGKAPGVTDGTVKIGVTYVDTKALLKSGLHTESGTVEISQTVTLVGETGAVLQSDTQPSLTPDDEVEPALWVHGASNVVIRGIEMRPAGAIGGTGILLHNSPNASVFDNNIHDVEFGVLAEKADQAKVWSNRVACSTGWLGGAIPEALGITGMQPERVGMRNLVEPLGVAGTGVDQGR